MPQDDSIITRLDLFRHSKTAAESAAVFVRSFGFSISYARPTGGEYRISMSLCGAEILVLHLYLEFVAVYDDIH